MQMIFHNRNRNVNLQSNNQEKKQILVNPDLHLLKNQNKRIKKYDMFSLPINPGKCASCGN